ncbi:hypothetical protein P8H26_17900 [Pseudochrobactrum sp. sp1633]|uniref:hypothetical protein n=1 Tax=Pseudochrobactrum sp. sp1633 TaxID=3036706 RepID=UPI0025A56CB7|nr:hypothetical protein [Pseudochrobactrum sp. sp1633]MDM8347253.1 hypothetical protein [Pseudochrobactrum sp. sp1633]
MTKISIKTIPLCLSLMLAPGVALADAPTLFNQAISSANQIREDAPTKDRLLAYEKTLETMDKIVREYPASNETRIILSGQTSGKFSPGKIRTGYITELTNFYDTVCEASPSYMCLAFVSLKNGSDSCNQAKTVADVEAAYDHLANALKIFSTQSENSIFASVTVSTARQCVAKNMDAWNRDYFGSKLVDMLLVNKEESTAKAVIENMTTPYFKFEGVLALKKASNSLVDQAYLDRLDRYIDENLGKSGAVKAPTDAFLATLRLRSFALSNSEVPIEYGYAYDAVQKYRNYGEERACNSQYVSYLFNMLLDYQTKLAFLPESRRGINNTQIAIMMDTIATHPGGVLYSCSEGGYYDLVLMARIHGRLLLEKGQEKASTFRKILEEKSLTREELIEYYLTEMNPTAEQLIASYFLDGKELDGARRILYISGYDRDTGKPLTNSPATFPVFKRLVDFGEVCRSSEILFRVLAKTDRFDKAIQYMIDSPAIDVLKKHSCGDEDLELLLE